MHDGLVFPSVIPNWNLICTVFKLCMILKKTLPIVIDASCKNTIEVI